MDNSTSEALICPKKTTLVVTVPCGFGYKQKQFPHSLGDITAQLVILSLIMQQGILDTPLQASFLHFINPAITNRCTYFRLLTTSSNTRPPSQLRTFLGWKTEIVYKAKVLTIPEYFQVLLEKHQMSPQCICQ